MRDYGRNDRGGDRGGRRFGGRDSGRREMHKATCAECGNSCEVPFRPSGDRPVYCSNCFQSRRNEDGNSRISGGRNFGRPKYEERRSYSSSGGDNGQLMEQIKSLHVKLDNILSALEPKAVQSITLKKEVADIASKPEVLKSKAPKKKVKEEKV